MSLIALRFKETPETLTKGAWLSPFAGCRSNQAEIYVHGEGLDVKELSFMLGFLKTIKLVL